MRWPRRGCRRQIAREHRPTAFGRINSTRLQQRLRRALCPGRCRQASFAVPCRASNDNDTALRNNMPKVSGGRDAHMRALAWLALAAVASVWLTAVQGAEFNRVATHPRSSPVSAVLPLIVKLRAPPASTMSPAGLSEQARIQRVATRAGLLVEQHHSITAGMHVLRVNLPASSGGNQSAAAAVLAQLRSDPDVEYAVPDERRYVHALTRMIRSIRSSGPCKVQPTRRARSMLPTPGPPVPGRVVWSSPISTPACARLIPIWARACLRGTASSPMPSRPTEATVPEPARRIQATGLPARI